MSSLKRGNDLTLAVQHVLESLPDRSNPYDTLKVVLRAPLYPVGSRSFELNCYFLASIFFVWVTASV